MSKFMKKYYGWIISHWWVILICIMIIYIVVVSVINNPELNRITTTAFYYFNQIIAPLGVIIGLILGYPLLKRKLIDSYITKQFEIIHDNNRIVRKECLQLKEKYPIKYISQSLNQEYLTVILDDVKRLNELAIDANPDAYKYSYLLYKSLETFSGKIKSDIPDNFYESYYCETLSTFVHNHIDRIYLYSKSIGFVPQKNNIKEKIILTSKLKRYITDNKYYQVEGIDHTLLYKHTSALLVAFFLTNIKCLSATNSLLFQSSYEEAPSPCPFARIMYSQSIYMPLVLEGEILMDILVPKLVLVGYVRMKSTKIESGISTYYIICHYANISEFGFVDGCIKDKQSLSKYKDAYIEDAVFNVADIDKFDINGERIIIQIDEKIAMRYFVQIKDALCKKMDKEIR